MIVQNINEFTFQEEDETTKKDAYHYIGRTKREIVKKRTKKAIFKH